MPIRKSGQFSFNVTDDKVNVNVTYNKVESSDEGFLDYITVNVRTETHYDGKCLILSGINLLQAAVRWPDIQLKIARMQSRYGI